MARRTVHIWQQWNGIRDNDDDTWQSNIALWLSCQIIQNVKRCWCVFDSSGFITDKANFLFQSARSLMVFSCFKKQWSRWLNSYKGKYSKHDLGSTTCIGRSYVLNPTGYLWCLFAQKAKNIYKMYIACKQQYCTKTTLINSTNFCVVDKCGYLVCVNTSFLLLLEYNK